MEDKEAADVSAALKFSRIWQSVTLIGNLLQSLIVPGKKENLFMVSVAGGW